MSTVLEDIKTAINALIPYFGYDPIAGVSKVESRQGSSYIILGANGTSASNLQSWYFAGGVYPTAGTFTISWGGQTTSGGNIPNWNDDAATIKTKLESLSSIGAGNVSVSGGPVNSAPLIIQFLGALAAAGPALTPTFNTSGLTGGGVLTASPLLKNGAGVLFGMTISETAAGAITIYDSIIDSGKVLGVLKASIAEGDYLQGSASFSNALMFVGAAASKVIVRSR